MGLVQTLVKSKVFAGGTPDLAPKDMGVVSYPNSEFSNKVVCELLPGKTDMGNAGSNPVGNKHTYIYMCRTWGCECQCALCHIIMVK